VREIISFQKPVLRPFRRILLSPLFDFKANVTTVQIRISSDNIFNTAKPQLIETRAVRRYIFVRHRAPSYLPFRNCTGKTEIKTERAWRPLHTHFVLTTCALQSQNGTMVSSCQQRLCNRHSAHYVHSLMTSLSPPIIQFLPEMHLIQWPYSFTWFSHRWNHYSFCNYDTRTRLQVQMKCIFLVYVGNESFYCS
jgi:hypothetical protein